MMGSDEESDKIEWIDPPERDEDGPRDYSEDTYVEWWDD
jgi:hypothetical protein